MNSKLLARYFKGACSPEEVQEVLNWFEGEEIKPEQEQDLYRLWQEAEQDKEKPEYTGGAARLLEKLNQAIDHQQGETFQVRDGKPAAEHPPRISRWSGWLKAAAAVLIPLGCWWVYGAYFSPRDQAAAAEYITIQAPAGTRQTIRLEDGSKITLNAGSQVSYRQHFPNHKRAVKLSGEAFFEVAQDKQRPFIVSTGNITTQALGTSFNIKYRLKEQDIAVALATGAVQIAEKAKGGGNNRIARLKPGQQLVYNREDQGYRVSAFDPAEVLAWQKGVLYFKKADLNQVVNKLETWYGVEIEIKGTGKENEWHYTGTYDNQGLDEVLAGISFVKDFTYEKKGNKIILKFKKPGSL